jgi:ribulose-phosphate 3-epimerase
LLSADFGIAGKEMASMTAAGADIFHLDVMDGHFVPNLSFGPFIVAALRHQTDLILDAHLMVTYPDQMVEPFAQAGADALTFHVESESQVSETLAATRENGMKAGLSLRPGTELALLEPYLKDLDLVLVMSVEPGFGGQSFMPAMVQRIAALAELRTSGAGDYAISVDGGINAETGRMCREAGADILVAGSYLFKADDRAAAVSSLRSARN